MSNSRLPGLTSGSGQSAEAGERRASSGPEVFPTLREREAALLAAERAVREREMRVELREKIMQIEEAATQAASTSGGCNDTQLREANERLVVASIRAQTLTEAAEGAAARMAYMAEHDVLTGLPNRSLLTARLTQWIALAKRHCKKVALMYLDLDHFKHVNDSLGHSVGDQLLQSAARRLQSCVRLSDTVCRQGGDEFVVLLAEIDTERDAALAADKLIGAMAEPHQIGEHRLYVTLSIGISIYPDDCSDVETIIKNADIAMYHAKRQGRNNYQMFATQMNVRAVARKTVQDSLRHGLEEREFVLHYQPKVNLETGEITGAEALIRLEKAGRELIYPTQFVTIAEDCGLMLPIGKWVLREACRQAAAWLQAGLAMGPIAVNVSAVEFHSKDFLAGVRGILEETGLDPCQLEFELTESGLIQDTDVTITTLHKLKDLGVQIAVDDFGTGYSSLSYLRRFPIDTLKIDQSFVQDIDADTEDAAIVNAIIAMGKSLKLRVVAEGIETPQQLAFLQSRHCAEGQGYYFNRPMPADEFVVLLQP